MENQIENIETKKLKLISFDDSEGKNRIGTTDDEVVENTKSVSIYECIEKNDCSSDEINEKTKYDNIDNLKIFNVGNTITFNYNDTQHVKKNVTNKIVEIYKTYINLDDECVEGYSISYIENISIVNNKGGKRRTKKAAKKNKKNKKTAKKQKKSTKKTKRHR